MAISRFQKAPESVRGYFNKSPQKVFTLEEIDFIFQRHTSQWSLRASTAEDFEKQLVQSNILQAGKFKFAERIKTQIRFWSTKADLYDVVIGK